MEFARNYQVDIFCVEPPAAACGVQRKVFSALKTASAAPTCKT
jgi:hypothetical protein